MISLPTPLIRPMNTTELLPCSNATIATPRTAILPYSGQLWPRKDGWHGRSGRLRDHPWTRSFEFSVRGSGDTRRCPLAGEPRNCLIVTIVVIRTVFLTQLQTCEPRYVLVCFPALLALGAQSWRNRWKLAPALERTVPAPQRAAILPDRGQ